MLGLYSKDKKPLCSLFCGNKSNIINIEVCIRHQTLCSLFVGINQIL